MHTFANVLFDNIGQKLKTMATATFVLGIIGSVLLAIYQFYEFELFGLSILTCIIGILVFRFFSVIIYGFGELIDSTSEIVYNTSKSNQKA